MKITDALLGEHGVFHVELDHLERAVPEAAAIEQVHAQAALLAASLGTHAGLEDELLFAALEPYLGSEAGPLAVMRMEHDEIEHSLQRLPEIQNLSEAQGLLLHLVQVAQDHFTKEEHVLFPMAQQMLDAPTLVRLGADWAERRGVPVR